MSRKKQVYEKITALYCRISLDDGGDNESMSISNQKLMLRDFAEKHGMFQYEYYVDDGYTGRNFNRPSFQRMIAKLYRQYLVVGGMPECVMQFVQTGDYILIRHTQDTILTSYLNDMGKYNNLNEIKKTRLAYDNITVQLSKKNTRFQYKLIKKGGRASEFENAIEWLCLSGIVSQVYRVEQIKKPLENYRDIDAFKIYVSDLGLLCAKKDLAANDILYMVEELNDFKGGMTENYVNVQLAINGYNTYYWESERGAEIDFVIQRDGQLIPIEVKSADNTRAKSLKVYMDTYKPAYAIKLSAKNFAFEDNKKVVPLYAAFCI